MGRLMRVLCRVSYVARSSAIYFGSIKALFLKADMGERRVLWRVSAMSEESALACVADM